jgi:AP-3 complex subunit sigma
MGVWAVLIFRFVVDGAESELGILDLIQVFVESLDRAFENVCELDLIFHFDEVLLSLLCTINYLHLTI